MRAVDTNVLVRLLARDEARQVAAAEKFVAPGAWVSHLVLVETLWVLASVYGVRRREIASAVDLLLQHRALTLQDASVVAAALERFRQRSGTSFSDCLILEVALAAGHSPLGTFDAALGKATGAQRL